MHSKIVLTEDYKLMQAAPTQAPSRTVLERTRENLEVILKAS